MISGRAPMTERSRGRSVDISDQRGRGAVPPRRFQRMTEGDSAPCDQLARRAGAVRGDRVDVVVALVERPCRRRATRPGRPPAAARRAASPRIVVEVEHVQAPAVLLGADHPLVGDAGGVRATATGTRRSGAATRALRLSMSPSIRWVRPSVAQRRVEAVGVARVERDAPEVDVGAVDALARASYERSCSRLNRRSPAAMSIDHVVSVEKPPPNGVRVAADEGRGGAVAAVRRTRGRGSGGR